MWGGKIIGMMESALETIIGMMKSALQTIIDIMKSALQMRTSMVTNSGVW